MRPEKSIILITKDRPGLLRKAVDSVRSSLNNAGDTEILIVDETAVPVSQNWPEGVRYITIPVQNRGFGYARRLSVSLARGKIIAFVDDDVVVAANWAEEIFKPFDNPNIAAVGGAVLPVTEGITLLGRIVSLLGFPAGGLERFLKAKGGNQSTGLISACNCAFRPEIGLKVGGFDELLRWGGEDQEFFARIADRHKTLFVPVAVVYHHQRTSMLSGFRWFLRRGKADFFMKCKYHNPFASLLFPLRSNFSLKAAVAAFVFYLAGSQGMPIGVAAALMIGAALCATVWIRRREWVRIIQSHPGDSDAAALFSKLVSSTTWCSYLFIKAWLDMAFETGRYLAFCRYIWNRVFHKPWVLEASFREPTMGGLEAEAAVMCGDAERLDSLLPGGRANHRLLIGWSKLVQRFQSCPNTLFFEKLIAVRPVNVSSPEHLPSTKLIRHSKNLSRISESTEVEAHSGDAAGA